MPVSDPRSQRRSAGILVALGLLGALGACATMKVPVIAHGGVGPLNGPAVSDNRTPLDPSYVCYAHALRAHNIPPAAVAVGAVPDYTGKLSQFEGSAVTQGGSLMVFSALSKLGDTVSVHERFDTRVTELELAYSDKQRLGDGRTHEVNGQQVPWVPYFGGTIEKSDVYIVGGITELNYNIRSGGAEARIGQTGPKARTFTLNVAVDLRLVDTSSLRVRSAVSVQKQIVGQEVGFEMFRFLSGADLVDINVGSKAQEPIQFAVRSAIEAATLKLLGDYTGVDYAGCLPDDWKLPGDFERSAAASASRSEKGRLAGLRPADAGGREQATVRAAAEAGTGALPGGDPGKPVLLAGAGGL